jgi:thymidylate synthase
MGLVSTIAKDRALIDSRNGITHEIPNGQVAMDIRRPIVSLVNRRLGYRFMAREAWWILSGRNDVATIGEFGDVARFSDDGQFFFGAYGPRLVDQLPYLIDILSKDFATRQAVATIWRESPKVTRDVPCSLSVQFLVRGGHLHCFYNMRSSDVWLGAPYDWFSFSMFTCYLLLCLRQTNEFWYRVNPGTLYYTAASCHLYDEHFPKALDIVTDPLVWGPCRELQIDEFRTPHQLIDHLYALSLWKNNHGPTLNHEFAKETVSWHASLSKSPS